MVNIIPINIYNIYNILMSTNDEPTSRNIIHKTKASLESIRCEDFDKTTNKGLLRYILWHIEKYIKEILLELKLFIIDDGSDSPSIIPFMWERVKMDYRKQEANKSHIDKIGKITEDTPPMTEDIKNKIIYYINILNFSESINKIQETIKEKSENVNVSFITEIEKSLKEKKEEIEKRQKTIEGQTLKVFLSTADSKNEKKNIDKALKAFDLMEGSRAKIKVINSKTGEKSNTPAFKFIWEFIKYYKKNFILSVIFLYFLIHLISGAVSSITSPDGDTRSEGLGKLIFGIVIIYFIYTIIKTETITPILKALALCFVWGIVYFVFKYAHQFYSIFVDNCKKTPSKSYNSKCRDEKIPFQNATLSDIILLFSSFSLLLFSIRQMGILFDYNYSTNLLSRIESLEINQWIEQDWIIFKVLVVIFVVLLMRDLATDKVENTDPLVKVSYVFFGIALFIAYIQYVVGNKFLEHKTSTKHLKNIGKFADKITQLKSDKPR